MRMTLLAVTTALCVSTSAFAADEKGPKPTPVSTDISVAPAGEYVVEKSHASILFKVNHMGFADYTMRFNDFDATINLNPTAPEKSTVSATIKPASLDSNNPKLTEHTAGTDFFNVAKYPTITFTSTKIEKTDANHGKIYGDMTMLGVTKPVVLDATFNAGGQHSFFKKYDIGFNATTTIKRSDFGMSFGIGMVGDNVDVEINAEFVQK